MTLLRWLAYLLATLLACAVGAVYAYVIIAIAQRHGFLAPTYAAGLPPALAG